MEPYIQRELDKLRKMIEDLRRELERRDVQLGHRITFDEKRAGEVPSPGSGDPERVLRANGTWSTVSGTVSGSSGITSISGTNLGSGIGVFASASAGQMTFRSISGSGGTSVQLVGSTVIVSSSIGSVETGSSVSTGSGYPSIWDYPLNPHPWNDEFNDTVLSASWQYASASGTFTGGIDPYATFASGPVRMELHTTRRKSWVMFQPSQDGAGHGIYFLTSGTVPTNMFFLFRGSFGLRASAAPVNNDASFGLALVQAPGGVVNNNNLNDVILLQLNEQDANTVQYEFSKIQGGAATSVGVGFDYYVVAPVEQPSYSAMGVQKLGTTYHGWIFNDAGSPLYLGSTTWTGSLDAVMIRVLNAGAPGAPGNMILGFDFVRFFSSSVYLP